MTAPGALPDARAPLSPEEADCAFATIMDGGAGDEDIARFLVEMADRGETVDELVAAARALRTRMIPVEAPEGAIDVCGTGGDGKGSLNVSTAVAILVAACGVPVAKHGNRAASSKSGAADVLGALGLDLNKPPAHAEATLAELGIAFLFAANHHPSMARVAGVRRALGRRTIFNLLGPLANPAEVKRQLVGVFARAWVRPLAETLGALGAEAALVVHGADGLDEISISGPTFMVGWADGSAGDETQIAPESLGLACYPVEALNGGDAAFNAAALSRMLAGQRGAYRDAVCLNAAAALVFADKVEDTREGIALAAEAIDTGAARDLLARWIVYS